MDRHSQPAAPGEMTPAWPTDARRAAGALGDATVASATWERIGDDRGLTTVRG